MELNWSTFLLEIINFLILVWILKRFLYRPVLDVITRRRAGIEETLVEAEKMHQEAEQLRLQYDGRLAAWEKERQQARDNLAREMETERARKMTELEATLQQEKEKMHVAESRRQADTARKMEETALQQGARFATRLLEQASGADTEARLIEMAISGLDGLPQEQTRSMRKHAGKADSITVTTAYPVTAEQSRRIEQALSDLVKQDLPVQFKQDSQLMAGIRITIGAWVLGINLHDELEAFTELTHVE